MSRFKVFALASCVGLFSAVFAPTLKADQWNKRTILTVNEPIQIPNKTLQPGKYVMKLMDSPSNRHIVQIFDEGEQHLITTVLAIPNYRLQPTGKTQFGFWETPAGQPKALRSWFYPGDNFGQEFAYPKNEAMQIASTGNQAVPTTYAQNESELTTARVGTVDQSGSEHELDQNTYAENNQNNNNNQTARDSMPTGTAAQENQNQNQQMAQNTMPQSNQPSNDRYSANRQRSLPRTASPYPMLGLIGLLSLGAFGLVTLVARRVS